MAKKNESTEATYSEEMTARVNQEGNHHEVLLRGTKTANSLVLRNQHGAKGFKNGGVYTVSFTEVTEDDGSTDDGKVADKA